MASEHDECCGDEESRVADQALARAALRAKALGTSRAEARGTDGTANAMAAGTTQPGEAEKSRARAQQNVVVATVPLPSAARRGVGAATGGASTVLKVWDAASGDDSDATVVWVGCSDQGSLLSDEWLLQDDAGSDSPGLQCVTHTRMSAFTGGTTSAWNRGVDPLLSAASCECFRTCGAQLDLAPPTSVFGV